MSIIFKRLKISDYLIVILTFLCVLAQTYFEMESISYTEKFLNLIKFSSPISEFWRVGFEMLGVIGIIIIASIFKSIFASYFSSKVAKNLRKEVFEKVNNFSSSEINKFSTPSLITRSTNDITQVQRTVQLALTMMFTAPCMALFAILRITESSYELTWVSVIFLGIMLTVLICMICLIVPKFTMYQKLVDRMNLVTRENLTGIRVVRAYNGEKTQTKKFDEANTKLAKTDLFVSRIFSLLNPTLSLIMNGMSLVIYWVGGSLINIDKINYPAIATFSNYSMHIIMSFMFITLMFVMIPRGIVSMKRINEIINTENSIKDGGIDKTEPNGTIEFRDVTFNYPDAEEPVLEDINFTVSKGETVAFIGSTGSGKSTLINLIPRFYDATVGQVLVDGVDVKAYNIEALHNKIGYVPQKANLFSGDITSNMKFAKNDITEDEITLALETAQCTFIEKLEDGYTQPVSQGGKNFSGGQKQRLSIARAIAKAPEILIFDDSFSALDFKTDKALRQALKKNTKNVTTLIVAQRVSTIMNADKIIVLNAGKIVGMGTHKELLENNVVYKEIYDSQTKKEDRQ